MCRLMRRPSPALVIAMIALVAAFTQNAIADGVNAVSAALKSNSVTSKTVKNGSLTLADFKKTELKKLIGKTGAKGATGATGAPGAQGPAGTPNGYTKDEANAAFLAKSGKAADSDKLDGKDSTEFVSGNGTQADGFTSLTASATSSNFLAIPGLGKISLSCSATLQPNATWTNTSGATVSYTSTFERSGNPAVVLSQSAADGGTFSIPGDAANGHQETLMLQRGGLFTGSFRATVILSAIHTGSNCRYQAQAFSSSSGGLVFIPLADKK